MTTPRLPGGEPTAHDLTVHELPVGDLALLPGNPRQGDIGAVSESMRVNGVYQPIIVNRGTLTGRPLEVIAGNHRAQAAQQLGHDTIPAVILDVDDEQAARIALADNRTSDLATYDNEALAAMLQNLPDLTGTGYDGDDLDTLITSLGYADGDDWASAMDALPDGDPTVATRTFTLTAEQATIVDAAIETARDHAKGDGNANGLALAYICERVQW